MHSNFRAEELYGVKGEMCLQQGNGFLELMASSNCSLTWDFVVGVAPALSSCYNLLHHQPCSPWVNTVSFVLLCEDLGWFHIRASVLSPC